MTPFSQAFDDYAFQNIEDLDASSHNGTNDRESKLLGDHGAIGDRIS